MAKAPPQRAKWFRATDASSIGIEIVVAITVGTLGGLWLEAKVTHWSPWTTLIGLAVGLGASVKALMRATRSYKRSLAELPPSPPVPPDDPSYDSDGDVRERDDDRPA
jgi:F0F1-type ATP synthase assembly protein I